MQHMKNKRPSTIRWYLFHENIFKLKRKENNLVPNTIFRKLRKCDAEWKSLSSSFSLTFVHILLTLLPTSVAMNLKEKKKKIKKRKYISLSTNYEEINETCSWSRSFSSHLSKVKIRTTYKEIVTEIFTYVMTHKHSGTKINE